MATNASEIAVPDDRHSLAGDCQYEHFGSLSVTCHTQDSTNLGHTPEESNRERKVFRRIPIGHIGSCLTTPCQMRSGQMCGGFATCFAARRRCGSNRPSCSVTKESSGCVPLAMPVPVVFRLSVKHWHSQWHPSQAIVPEVPFVLEVLWNSKGTERTKNRTEVPSDFKECNRARSHCGDAPCSKSIHSDQPASPCVKLPPHTTHALRPPILHQAEGPGLSASGLGASGAAGSGWGAGLAASTGVGLPTEGPMSVGRPQHGVGCGQTWTGTIVQIS